jgi:hypothetical protein
MQRQKYTAEMLNDKSQVFDVKDIANWVCSNDIRLISVLKYHIQFTLKQHSTFDMNW